MHIDAGRLRCRITFQRFDGACDAYGAPLLADDEHWADYASAWAAVDPLSGREFFAAEQSQSEVTHRVLLRYMAGIETEMRIRYGKKRILEIVSVRDVNERHEYLQLLCRELVR